MLASITSRQAVRSYPLQRGDANMEKPQKVVYLNGGQTKVTLIGKWFHMTGEEIREDYERRLEAGDPFAQNINNVLCEVIEKGSEMA
jgi:hypothetical protein